MSTLYLCSLFPIRVHAAESVVRITLPGAKCATVFRRHIGVDANQVVDVPARCSGCVKTTSGWDPSRIRGRMRQSQVVALPS